ncbi:flagellin/flagellar hook associated protein [Desulfitobacterium dichloroeliminans LMG P-21439]|uniref:Flagellin n=1 Tax=Desulfitobacterium dichloroeliminans (strain LMG P-21439 / DCA1) TaxID=871963 RepID=L0FBH4_DESDL|nr:flagellinolysin [Desulfitobacterium dichloroeliminans]AGA70298.1 flagellin/flagellar hook associated protein [Desulfitobacterium dichloroeliminans LMG P-21439]
MIIYHNISAQNTFNKLSIKQNEVSKGLKKVSSGLRINNASDDAAGLTISEKMRGQIRGLSQAIRNAQDAISLVQTAEGAAASIQDMLQRSRELSVQAANGTLTNEDRAYLQDEMVQILSNIEMIANDTEFNTKKLLNQSGSVVSQYTGISQAALDELTSKLPGWLNDSMVAIYTRLGIDYPDSPIKRPMRVEYYYNDITSTGASMGTADGGATLTLRVNTAKVFDGSGNLRPEGILDTLLAHEMVHAFQFTEMPFSRDGVDTAEENWFIEGLAMTIQGGNLFGVTDHHVSMGYPFDGDYRSAYEAVKVLHEVTDDGINAIIDRLEAGDTLDQALLNTTQNFTGTELDGAIGAADLTTATEFINWFNANSSSAGVLNTYLMGSADFTQGSGVITIGGAKGSSSDLTLDQTIPNATGVATLNTHFTLDFVNSAGSVGLGEIVFHVGANSGQNIPFQSFDLRTSALELVGTNIKTQSGANAAIGTINKALGLVSNARSYFGAVQNRLEHTILNLANAEENITASELRIRDVDLAKEMMNFQKSSILSQAAQAMLAQANFRPQEILQLLK